MFNKIKTFILERILGRCGHCQQWFVYPKRRRMNTQYEHEESNYVTECNWCFEATEQYWAEMWDDFYSGRL